VGDLAADRTVLVAAHGNSLRALVKHLDGIADADIAALELPTGIPMRFELDDDFQPVDRGAPIAQRFLGDVEAAKAAAEAVARQAG
jgi:2,3-bisphosphoglycerate-dependent phosphoglycerate mutase